MLKKEVGVTFILLVITIIVLLIVGTAVATAGISTYNESKVKIYLKEMDAIREKINLYQQKANINPDLNFEEIGRSVDEIESARNVLNTLEINEDEYNEYRYLSSKDIASELSLENISDDIIINVKSKKIYSISPIKYNDKLYNKHKYIYLYYHIHL